MDAQSWSPPAAFSDQSGPGRGGDEDLADALSIASKSAKGHVAVLGRQDHLLDGGHLGGSELARAGTQARRPVGEFAGVFGSSPSAVSPRFQAEDAQDDGQGKERFGAGNGVKNASLGLSFWETVSTKVEARGAEQGEQEANDGGEHPSLLLPPSHRIECVLQVLADRGGGNDGTEAASSPGGNGETGDLHVVGNGRGAAANDMFSEPVVVGTPGARRVRDVRYHPGRFRCASENRNDIRGAANANKKLRMSSFAAGLCSSALQVAQ
jgi:hypothetical protein